MAPSVVEKRQFKMNDQSESKKIFSFFVCFEQMNKWKKKGCNEIKRKEKKRKGKESTGKNVNSVLINFLVNQRQHLVEDICFRSKCPT